MIRVYVAGPLSSKNRRMENMRRMIQISTRLFMLGLAPFCPCLNYHFELVRSDLDEPITDQSLLAWDFAFLETCKALLVLPGWKKSRGTRKEIKLARRLGIPVFYDPDRFFLYFNLDPEPILTVLWEQWNGEAA